MNIQVFTIPAFGGSTENSELNQFLASNRIAGIQREFINDGLNSHWSICVTTADADSTITPVKKSRVDYREVLSEQDFAMFAKLRTLRKEMSEKEGVPPYTLFTNEQLAEMVRRRVATDTALVGIDGIGPGRVSKYGETFLAELKSALTSIRPANEEIQD